MTNELEPCPFCGRDMELKEWDAVGVCMHCSNPECWQHGYVIFTSKEAAIAACNTRYKRTCHMENDGLDADPDGLVGYTCTRCGFGMSYPYDSKPTGWCAGCGAEVVDD